MFLNGSRTVCVNTGRYGPIKFSNGWDNARTPYAMAGEVIERNTVYFVSSRKT